MRGVSCGSCCVFGALPIPPLDLTTRNKNTQAHQSTQPIMRARRYTVASARRKNKVKLLVRCQYISLIPHLLGTPTDETYSYALVATCKKLKVAPNGAAVRVPTRQQILGQSCVTVVRHAAVKHDSDFIISLYRRVVLVLYMNCVADDSLRFTLKNI